MAQRRAWLHLFVGLLAGPVSAEALVEPVALKLIPALDMRGVSLVLGWMVALKINQDSAVVAPGQSRANGEEGSREALSRTVTAITLGRNMAARRVEKLTPAPEDPTPPAD